MKLTFLGGARIVTGVCYLLETKKSKILIDCGLFQGSKIVEEENYEDFYFDPKSIDYLLVTHAHLDHIGRIPLLYHRGFRGKIFATHPTIDFSRLMLLDSQRIIEEEARIEGKPFLYSSEEVEKCLELFQGVNYEEKIELTPEIFCRFREAGHILGSSLIEVFTKNKKIVFSGDLGNAPVPLLRPSAPVEQTDYLVIESAYGDRNHESIKERKLILERIIEDTVTRGGVLIIPIFALERTQELLYELNSLVENSRIPRVPIFLDSPLAIRATEIYKKYSQYYNLEARYLIKSGDEIFQFPGLKFTLSREESKNINLVKPPKIILAASSISQGGRIRYHEKLYLSDSKNCLLIIAYQIKGSLGRKLFEGEKSLEILGERIKVRAEIKAIGGYSAHADQTQLLKFIKYIKKPIKKIFITQGEEPAARALAYRVENDLGIETNIPKYKESVELK